ncbi:MAG: NAD(P)/FAD-dependent oxidoreductase [Thermoplasmata archaeon]
MTYDVIVVGGGPVGLAASIFCTYRRLSTLVLEARKLGGQLTSLYPSKSIYDYPSYMAIEADELGRLFIDHAKESGCELREGEEVLDIQHEGGLIKVATNKNSYACKAVIIALGMGLFEPRRLNVPGEMELEGRGVYYKVTDRAEFEGKKVIVVGGGDSALENALTVVAVAENVTLVHRREEFRAMEKNVEAVRQSPIKVLMNTEVIRVLGEESVEACILFNNRTGEQFDGEFDAVVVQIGLSPRVHRLKEWGLELVGRSIRVDIDMSTSVEGVFACGDVVTYEGKDKRISSGCGEAAVAAMSVYKYIRKPYWA